MKPMELTLTRTQRFPSCTLGTLQIAGLRNYRFDTLEPRAINWARDPKIAGQTAIPTGRYRIRFRWSERYQRLMPFLTDVPHFEGIMLHTGNTVDDTEGCILIGQADGSLPRLKNSRLVFTCLYGMLKEANVSHQEIWITVKENFG